MDKTIEQRIVVAAPSQLRQMAREGMASHVPDEAAREGRRGGRSERAHVLEVGRALPR